MKNTDIQPIVIKLQLNSKNNKERGSYLYSVILRIGDKYFRTESIKTNKVLKVSELTTDKIPERKFEILPEFYERIGLKPFRMQVRVFKTQNVRNKGEINLNDNLEIVEYLEATQLNC